MCRTGGSPSFSDARARGHPPVNWGLAEHSCLNVGARPPPPRHVVGEPTRPRLLSTVMARRRAGGEMGVLRDRTYWRARCVSASRVWQPVPSKEDPCETTARCKNAALTAQCALQPWPSRRYCRVARLRSPPGAKMEGPSHPRCRLTATGTTAHVVTYRSARTAARTSTSSATSAKSRSTTPDVVVVAERYLKAGTSSVTLPDANTAAQHSSAGTFPFNARTAARGSAMSAVAAAFRCRTHASHPIDAMSLRAEAVALAPTSSAIQWR